MLGWRRHVPPQSGQIKNKMNLVAKRKKKLSIVASPLYSDGEYDFESWEGVIF